MIPPLLEIITRTNNRPDLLSRNVASVRRLGPRALHTIIDGAGRGMTWAQETLCHNAPNLTGDYVMVLDDDDEIIAPNLLDELAAVVGVSSPDVVMVQMDHGQPLGIMPRGEHWGVRPQLGHVGASAFIVRRQAFQRHAAAYVPGEYNSDFNFINAVFDAAPAVAWLELVASRVNRRSFGV